MAFALLLLLLPSSLHAWGPEGHEIVAQPDVREKVVVLLDGRSFVEWEKKGVRNHFAARGGATLGRLGRCCLM